MTAQQGYVCDADSLINLHRHYPRPCLRYLRRHAPKGSLRIPEGVFRELRRGSDKLSRVVKELERSMVVRVASNARIQQELVRLENSYGEAIRVGNQSYGGFWQSASGRQAVDGQVVAVGMVLSLTVVSNDRAIALACSLEGVECIGWAELGRRSGLTVRSLSLGLNES